MNDCCDFDNNGESHESTAQRSVQGESSKSTHLPEISFISTASKPGPTPTSSISTTKRLDTTAKQIVKVKTTIKKYMEARIYAATV